MMATCLYTSPSKVFKVLTCIQMWVVILWLPRLNIGKTHYYPLAFKGCAGILIHGIRLGGQAAEKYFVWALWNHKMYKLILGWDIGLGLYVWNITVWPWFDLAELWPWSLKSCPAYISETVRCIKLTLMWLLIYFHLINCTAS